MFIAQSVHKSSIMDCMAKKSMVNLTRLEELMQGKRWGVSELATYSNVKYDTVYSLRKGRRLNTSANTLKAIAEALDTSVDYLLGESDDNRPPIEKLPEPVRQLAQIAGNLSEVRREELLRIAAALETLEREQADHPLPDASIDASIKIIEELRRNGGDADALDSLESLLRGTPPGESSQEADEFEQDD